MSFQKDHIQEAMIAQEMYNSDKSDENAEKVINNLEASRASIIEAKINDDRKKYH